MQSVLVHYLHGLINTYLGDNHYLTLTSIIKPSYYQPEIKAVVRKETIVIQNQIQNP
jgi:hypothetical protein